MTFKEKFLKRKFYSLNEKEIDVFIEEHWLEWAMKYELSPMGHLTLKGKQTYIDGWSEKINNLIKEFP